MLRGKEIELDEKKMDEKKMLIGKEVAFESTSRRQNRFALTLSSGIRGGRSAGLGLRRLRSFRSLDDFRECLRYHCSRHGDASSTQTFQGARRLPGMRAYREGR